MAPDEGKYTYAWRPADVPTPLVMLGYRIWGGAGRGVAWYSYVVYPHPDNRVLDQLIDETQRWADAAKQQYDLTKKDDFSTLKFREGYLKCLWDTVQVLRRRRK